VFFAVFSRTGFTLMGSSGPEDSIRVKQAVEVLILFIL